MSPSRVEKKPWPWPTRATAGKTTCIGALPRTTFSPACHSPVSLRLSPLRPEGGRRTAPTQHQGRSQVRHSAERGHDRQSAPGQEHAAQRGLRQAGEIAVHGIEALRLAQPFLRHLRRQQRVLGRSRKLLHRGVRRGGEQRQGQIGTAGSVANRAPLPTREIRPAHQTRIKGTSRHRETAAKLVLSARWRVPYFKWRPQIQVASTA
ncbi:hypothetical protein [Deinococcus hopiensis]|uniref:hypothetical protein n=1 Tax=Deinococcus hopiensis TaxID=309885 RepID=UPI00111C2A21|nr:hypothetical protein [Deinococcus hopiensis]